MLTMFGLRHCDTCRRARRWLDARGVDYCFHDLRRDGLEPGQLDAWLQALGAEVLINRRGRSWRALPAAERERADQAALRRLALAEPALIRRPLVVWGDGAVTAGFEPDRWSERIG